jgi:8-oxo-dGTP pyrophosphatase MutT (NUDIX family)
MSCFSRFNFLRYIRVSLKKVLNEFIINDNISYRFPVSLKGVILKDSKIILLKNERNEWELPGGKLEPGENSEDCLIREIREELGVDVSIDFILDSWVYNIKKGVLVVIITYGCHLKDSTNIFISSEHKELGVFPLNHIEKLNMPDGYKSSIKRWQSIQKL